jgi:multidrug resistance protein
LQDDPHNPYNWTTKKKWSNGGLLSALTLVTPLASSMFAPAIPEVLQDFKVTNTTIASFVVSIYVLGYAIGPLLIAPLSEIYGRLPVYHVTNILFVIFTIACAVSSNMGMLIGFRFLAGCMGATPLTIGGGTIGDMFRREERGVAMATWSIGPLLGPVIGPVAGAYLGEAKGWRWDFWLIAIVVRLSSAVSRLPSQFIFRFNLLRIGECYYSGHDGLCARDVRTMFVGTQNKASSKGNRRPEVGFEAR